MALPPEEPTRPMPPAGGPPPVTPYEPGYRERVVVDEDPFRAEVLKRLDGLRIGLVLVGVIALAALGLALWTFLRQDDDQARRGGDGEVAAQLQTFRAFANDLDAKVSKAPTQADVAALQKSLDALEGRVEDAESSDPVPASTEDAEARASIDQLSDSIGTLDQSVQDLDARIQALEETP